MNAIATFDTLAFVKKVAAAGMDSKQTEALAEAIGEVVFQTTATRTDLREFELKLAADLKDTEMRLSARTGAMVAASTALTVAILGALITLN